MRYNALTLALLLCHSPLVEADSVDHYVDISLDYSRGDFNTGQDSKLSRLQVTYGQVMEHYDFSVEVPYLFLSDSFGDESGLGDVTLRAGKTLSDKNPDADNLYASIAIKLPTANDSNGLGSGELDVGGFLTYTHDLNKMYLALLGGYIVTGDSVFQQREDIFVYGIGLSKIIAPWYVYGSLDGRQQTLSTGDDPLELSGGFFYQLNPVQFVKMQGFVGLSNSSSDLGSTIGFVNWF
jgi:hypothetical protein